MTKTFQLLAAVVLAVSLFGCGRMGGVPGSGNVVSERRVIDAFQRIEVSSNVDVTFAKGERGLEVTTDENLLSLVETRVREDGTLVIRVLSPIADNGGLKVAVTSPILEGVEVSGASSFTGPAANPADAFKIDASGASRVTLSGLVASKVIVNVSGASEVILEQGTSTSLTVAATGASQFASHGFTAQDVRVEVSGASKVCVTANQSISGNASGGSTVTVSGGPKTLEVNSSGGSRLIKEG